MEINRYREDRRLTVRLVQFLDYLLWLPLGTRQSALRELMQLRSSRIEWLYAYRDDHGRPMPAWRIVVDAALGLPSTMAIVVEVASLDGDDPRWVYRVADPLMVFLILPVFFILAGFSVGGSGGVVLSAALLLCIWLALVLRLRRSVRVGRLQHHQRLDAVVTLPNALTVGRLAALWFFPLLLAGDQDLRAMVFFVAIASTDWADGFIARHYNMQSRLGTNLDPATDRVMMIIVIGSLMDHGLIDFRVGELVVGREVLAVVLTMLFFRPRTWRGDSPVAVHWSGKLGFALVSLGVVIALSRPLLTETICSVAASVTMLVGVALNLIALYIYMLQVRRGGRLVE